MEIDLLKIPEKDRPQRGDVVHKRLKFRNKTQTLTIRGVFYL